MSYPDQILVNLLEINGTSCGSMIEEVDLQPGSSPPTYRNVTTSPFRSVTLLQSTNGGVTTWVMQIIRIGTPCQCNRNFRRATDADDPTGLFYAVDSNGNLDSSLGQARNDEM